MLHKILIRYLARRLCNPARKSDFRVGGDTDPYLARWYLIPRNKFFNIYLHQFLRDDDDRALHDHPWPSVSFLLSGQVMEVYRVKNSRLDQVRMLSAGQVVYRRASFAHRLVLERSDDGRPLHAWTLFITGPRIRNWGFLCPKGWRSYEEYSAPGENGQPEQGCD